MLEAGAHVRGGAWLSRRGAGSSAAPGRWRSPTRSPGAGSRARWSAPKAATPIPEITHPKVTIGNWTFSNWPLYIDKDVLKEFDTKYGGHVKYVEDINDNDEFYGKVRQQLQADQPIGRDIVTLTDFMAVKWVRNRYVEALDKKNIPNVVKNLVDNLKSVPYDKKRDFTVPWQSGAVGLGYNPKKTGRELNSINDLFDPAFKGRVTMLNEAVRLGLVDAARHGRGPDDRQDRPDPAARSRRSTRPATPASSAASPATTTRPTWPRATSGSRSPTRGHRPAPERQPGPEVRLSRRGRDALHRQHDGPEAKAEHIYAAEKMMDFVYEPEVAAKLAIYVNYLSPVKGVKEIVEKTDPEIANNPLIFPSDEIRAKLHPYPALSDTDERTMKEAMAKVTGAMSLEHAPPAAALAVHRPGPAVAADLLPVPAAQPGEPSR